MKSKNANWKDLEGKNRLLNSLDAGSFDNNHDKNFGPEQKEQKEDTRTGENLGSIKRGKQKAGIKGKRSRQGKKKSN